MWSRFIRWLHKPAIDDPVDRRNAGFAQVLFLLTGIGIPLNKLYILAYNEDYKRMFPRLMPHTPGLAVAIDVTTDALIALGACAGFVLIRLRHFRGGVGTALGALLGSGLIAYAAFGYWALAGDFFPIVALALGGLMLDRRALTLIYLTVIVQFATGILSDMLRQPSPGLQLGANLFHRDIIELPSRLLIYLLIAAIIERCSAAMRKSLAESDRHLHRLKHEMAERESAQEQLFHAQKMEAVGQLSSGIAHDFNNVLGIIQGFAGERHRLDEPGAHRCEDALALAAALQGVETAARRGASISRKLLDFARQGAAHDEVFDAAEALRDLQPLLRQLLSGSVRLQMHAGNAPLPIRFDRSQFELAVLNLAANARDAMPEGGQLTVRLEADPDRRAVIAISDDGVGMPDSVRQRIFEPFFTTKPPGLGTGLGLAVVRRLVDEAGGRIDVESRLGAGTTFRIRLPLAAAEAISPPTADAYPADTIRVLLVDDDDTLRELLAQALRKQGCDVSTAASGREALTLAGQAGCAPQVLVCDDRLPDTNSSLLLPRLRRHLPRTPVILISAYRGLGRREPPEDAHTERLPKPFAPEQLVSRVLQAARRSRLDSGELVQALESST